MAISTTIHRNTQWHVAVATIGLKDSASLTCSGTQSALHDSTEQNNLGQDVQYALSCKTEMLLVTLAHQCLYGILSAGQIDDSIKQHRENRPLRFYGHSIVAQLFLAIFHVRVHRNRECMEKGGTRRNNNKMVAPIQQKTSSLQLSDKHISRSARTEKLEEGIYTGNSIEETAVQQRNGNKWK